MKHSLLLLTLACTLLSSCVQWNLGTAIRDAVESRVGVDVAHPVDGLYHELPRTETRREAWYVRAPEVRYHRSTPLVERKPSYQLWPTARPAARLQPTGRVVLARISYESYFPQELRGAVIPGSGSWALRWRPCFEEEVAALPAGVISGGPYPRAALKSGSLPKQLVREEMLMRESQPLEMTAESLGTLSREERLCATFAAAPFDYLIDPALTCVSSTLYGVGKLLVTPFVYAAERLDDTPEYAELPSRTAEDEVVEDLR